MNVMKRLSTATIVIFLIVLGSCEPSTKEQYLQHYKSFIDEITERGVKYSASDWERADAKFKQFDQELYNKFKEELTFEEKMKVAAYKVKYNSIKAASEVNRAYGTYLKEDVEKIKKKIKYYVENDMEQDLDKLLDEVKEVSKDLHKELKKLIDELNKKK
jgi:DNA-directed RNA polymerase subunit L